MKNKIHICVFVLGPMLQSFAQSFKVPSVVANLLPESKTSMGSPSICVLAVGDYVPSHEHFGLATTEHQQAATTVFISNNKGSRGLRFLRSRGSSGQIFLFTKMYCTSWEPGNTTATLSSGALPTGELLGANPPTPKTTCCSRVNIIQLPWQWSFTIDNAKNLQQHQEWS